jgi:exosortase A
MSAVMPLPVMPAPWRRALPALVLLLLVWAALYFGSLQAMVGIWARSDTFAHAYLVAPIALWLVWRRRHRLAAIEPCPQPLWLLPMAVVALAWMLGELASVNALTQAAATAILVLAVPTLLGTAVAREIAFPLGFLFFMVPFGDFMVAAMMESTADFTVAALQLSGIPVYREGLQFIIPSGAWSVVEACSGVRYLIASFMVGTLFAYLNYRSLRKRAAFWVVALAVPVLANWLRAYMIVILGHLSGNTLAVGVDHLIYGWVFFGVVIGLMFFMGSRWAELDDDLSAAAVAVGLAPGAPAGRAGAGWGVALAAVLLAAAPHAVVWQFEHGPAGPAPALALPDLQGQGSSDTPPPLQPVFQGATAQASRSYVDGADTVAVHIAYYRHQHYGHKLISSENVLIKSEDKEWNRTATGATSVSVAGRAVTLRTYEVRSANTAATDRARRLAVRQVYWVGGRLTTSNHLAAALAVAHRLTGRGDDAAAITFIMSGLAEEGVAARLDAFVTRHLSALDASLAATQSR